MHDNMIPIVTKSSLARDPIVEAIFEARFTSEKPEMAGLLPGLFYSAFREKFTVSSSLDVNKIPPEVRENDPNLKYAATHRFAGYDNMMVNVGPRVFTVVNLRPYSGWEKFKPAIIEFLEHLKDKEVINQLERYSLRYLNLIEASGGDREHFSKIFFEGKLAGIDLVDTHSHIQTQVIHKGCVNRIKIAPNAGVKISTSSEEMSGLLLDIDTIKESPPSDFWEDLSSYLDQLHEAETDVFFSVVKPETLKQYGYLS